MTTAEMSERHVAVVGASTGIGFETARLLALPRLPSHRRPPGSPMPGFGGRADRRSGSGCRGRRGRRRVAARVLRGGRTNHRSGGSRPPGAAALVPSNSWLSPIFSEPSPVRPWLTSTPIRDGNLCSSSQRHGVLDDGHDPAPEPAGAAKAHQTGQLLQR